MEIVKAHKINGQQVFKAKNGEIIRQGRRQIKSGNSYNRLVNTSDVQFASSLTYGNVDKTVSLMTELIQNYHYQLNDLARYLQRDTELNTCKAIWEFVFNHIQYKHDKAGVEQLTSPARIWLNRSTEGTPSDCDDHSIFVGSLLFCLGIPFKIRIAGYEGKNFSHVYIVTKSNICIDTVLHAFNKEAYYTSKKDSKMMQIEVLHGLSGVGKLGELSELGNLGAVSSLAANALSFEKSIEQLLPSQSYYNQFGDDEEINGFDDVIDTQLEALKNLGKEQLAITLKAYEQEPELYHAKGFRPEYWRLMYKAYESFKKEDLSGIIVNLDNGGNWEKQNLSPMNGVADSDGVTGLMGLLGGFFKKIRRGFKKAVKWTGKTVKRAAKWTGKTVKKAASWVGGFLKKVARFMMKINPIMIAVRALLRAKINSNKNDLAITLGIGLMSLPQAKGAGIKPNEHDNAKRALAKFTKKYKFLGGSTSKLNSVISSAYRKHAAKAHMPSVDLKGFGDLESLEGRRSRRRRRRRARAAQEARARALAAQKQAIAEGKLFESEKKKQLDQKMSSFQKEQLDFLKVAFSLEAKRHGLAEPVTIASTAAAVPIATKIINWLLQMLSKLGLKDVIAQIKQKHIIALAKKAEQAAAKGAKALAEKLLNKKRKAENNLLIFNQQTAPKKPIPQKVTVEQKPVIPVINQESLTVSKTKTAGMNPFLIGGLLLVAGGAFLSSKDKKAKTTKKK